MASLVITLLLVIIQCMFIDCSKGTVKLVYRPYGLKMCREIFCSSTDTFLFLLEHLSCHRLSATKYSADLNTCLRNKKITDTASVLLSPGQDICHTEIQDGYETQLYLTANPILAGDLEPDRVSCGISLHQACEEGNLFVVKLFLSQKLVDINVRGKLGRTPVMAAARKNQIAVFDFLVGESCDLKAVDDCTDNILHCACEGGSVDIVSDLVVSQECDMEKRGMYGRTAVMTSAEYGHTNVFDFLVSKGCNISAVDVEMNNILHLTCISGNLDMVKHILSLHEYSIDSRNRVGRTPLMVAVHWGHIELYDFLVKRGSKTTLVDSGGNNILATACIGGNLDMVKYIISLQTFEMDNGGKFGRTPLLLAVRACKLEVVVFLISKGCEMKTIDNFGSNILHTACVCGDIDMVNYINSLKIFGIDSKGEYGRTPVMLAVYYGHVEVLDLLASKGCNMTSIDNNGNNILHMACMGGHLKMVKCVVSQTKFDIDCRGVLRRTPVMLASFFGYREVVTLLMNTGCDLTLIDNQGNNILHLACIGGHADMVKYLITLGIVKDLRRQMNKSAQSPIMVAESNDHAEIVNLLCKPGSCFTKRS